MTNLATEKGLTLVELMVVLSIIIITAAIAIPMYISDLPRQKANAVAQGLLGDLRMARAKAVANNASYLLCFNQAGESYTLRPETGAVMDCSAGTAEKTVDFTQNYNGVQFSIGPADQVCIGATSTDPINFVKNTARFNRLGSSVDGDNNFWSGAVYVMNIYDSKQQVYCAQVEGSSGRTRLYKWDKGQWK
ncbi:MAG: prepilin-type N-terminal cleavage/methylation domain-containing protein [Nitrospirae bacterium]|nr:prepilin-type N-terminal cleavage/methylation domain-containing protein [Nitrospirota bacterium]